jgi:hypothetical protein
MSEPPKPPGHHHLAEEALVELAQGAPAQPGQSAHLATCGRCREGLHDARSWLVLDGLEPRPSPRRSALWPLLAAAWEAEHHPGALAVRLSAAGALELGAHTLTVAAAAPLRLRAAGPVSAPALPALLQSFGNLTLRLELASMASPEGPRLRLGVGLPTGPVRRPVAALLLGARQLAVQPLSRRRTTFEDVWPAAYRLEVREGRVVVARLSLDVSEHLP